MKQILIKGLILLAIVILINSGIKMVWPAHFYAEKTYHKKYNDAKKTKPSVFFIGTSRTYRHIVPSIIDKGLGDTNLLTFNFGVNSLCLPYSFNVSKQLIKEFKPKVIVVELTEQLERTDIANADRLVAFSDFNTFISLNQEVFGTSMPIEKMFDYVFTSFKGLTSHYGNRGHFEHFVNRKRIDGINYLTFERGFISIDSIAHRNKALDSIRVFIQDSLKTRGLDYYGFDDYQKAISSELETFSIKNNMALDLIQYGKKHDCKVLYRIPYSPYRDEYKHILSVYNNIPEENRIAFDQELLKELCGWKYHWDDYHLNHEAAIKISSQVTKELKAKL